MVNKIQKEEKYLTTSEAAKILGLSRIAVFKKIKRGELPAHKIGRNYVIKRENLSPALKSEISEKDREFISDTTSRVIKEYGEVIRLLGRE